MRIARLLPLLLSLALLAGCKDSDYTKAAKAVNDVAGGLQAVEQIDENLYSAHVIDKDAAKAIAGVVVEASFVNDEAITLLKSTKALDTTSKTQLLAYIQQVVQDVNTLQQDGALYIKDPQSKASFDAAIAGVSGALTVVQGVLASQGVK